MEDPLSRLPMDFNAICRTCLKSGNEMKSIFAEYSEKVLISNMIGECSSIQVREMDGLPKLICEECLCKVASSYDFKQQCENSFRILKGFISDFKVENFTDVKMIDYKTDRKNEFTQTETEKLLNCEICDSKFLTEDDLQIHRSNHKDDDELKCLKCKKIYTRSINNELILEEIKSEENNKIEDEIDDKNIVLSDFLEVKAEDLQSEQTSSSRSTTSSEEEEEDDDDNDDIDDQDTENDENSDEPFKCDKCDKSFSEMKRLKIHQSRQHGNKKLYHCNQCEETFSRLDNLKSHKRQHNSNIVHECQGCNRTFNRSDYLRRHKCTNKDFRDIISSDKGTVPIKIEENDNLTDETTSSAKSRRPIGPKVVFCDICKKGFTKQNHLNTHKKIHEPRDWLCKSCKSVFRSREELREHKKTHANDRPFLCTECGMRFIRNDFLILHMRRHTGEKPFKCRYCDKGFIRPAAVAIHERYHTDEKPHLCTTCGKGFHRAYNLSVHIRVHTGERPYKCQHCEKTFVQSKDLKAHIQQHTGEHFKCDICGDNFIHLYLMNQHKRNLHGINIVSRIGRVKKFIKTADNEIIEKPPESSAKFEQKIMVNSKPIVENPLPPPPPIVSNETDYASYWGIGIDPRFRPHSPRYF